MTPLAHISSGIVAYQYVSYRFNTESALLLAIAIIGANAPDVDGLFGKKIRNHRNTIFHAPLFWLVFWAFFYLAAKNIFPAALLPGALFFIGVFVHLFLDWVSTRISGIWIFYPFSKKFYSLFPVQPEKGNTPLLPDKKHMKSWIDFWKFYLENRLLIAVELFVILSPIAIIAF